MSLFVPFFHLFSKINVICLEICSGKAKRKISSFVPIVPFVQQNSINYQQQHWSLIDIPVLSVHLVELILVVKLWISQPPISHLWQYASDIDQEGQFSCINPICWIWKISILFLCSVFSKKMLSIFGKSVHMGCQPSWRFINWIFFCQISSFKVDFYLIFEWFKTS